ncbi:hypothetical protein ACFWEJ_04600 [Promicromonospora sp. NPDC060204]|uniref:hypothetical protein n=1 Tax=Promicromonospora sp. NPDC060204 TaxID=3347071 RepID=UPI00365ED2C2
MGAEAELGSGAVQPQEAVRLDLAFHGDPARARKAVEEHMAGSYVRLRRLELPSDPEA